MKHKYPEATIKTPTGAITYTVETSQPLPKGYHTQQGAVAYVYSGPYILATTDRNLGSEFGDGPLGLDQWYECEPGVWIPNWHNLCASLIRERVKSLVFLRNSSQSALSSPTAVLTHPLAGCFATVAPSAARLMVYFMLC